MWVLVRHPLGVPLWAGLGCSVWALGLGLRVWALGFGLYGFSFRVWSLGPVRRFGPASVVLPADAFQEQGCSV